MMPDTSDPKQPDKKTGKGELFRALSSASMIGINLVICTFVGFSIGYWLIDPFFGTFPWFTIIFLLLGIAAGFKHLITLAMNQDKDDEETKNYK